MWQFGQEDWFCLNIWLTGENANYLLYAMNVDPHYLEDWIQAGSIIPNPQGLYSRKDILGLIAKGNLQLIKKDREFSQQSNELTERKSEKRVHI